MPDSLTNDLVRDRLAQDDAREGFLLDGYPRTIDQVHELDKMLAHRKASAEKAGVSLYALRALAMALSENSAPAGRLMPWMGESRAGQHEQAGADKTDRIVQRPGGITSHPIAPSICRFRAKI